MALSFTQTPGNATLDSTEVAVKGQALVLTAYESDSGIRANTGFRYKINVTYYVNGIAQDADDFYVPPNPSGYGSLDIRDLIDKISFVDSDFQGSSVHTSPSGALYAWDNENNYHQVDCEVIEAWEIDGVLTDQDDPSDPSDDATFYVFAGAFQPALGYNPDLSELRTRSGYPSDVYVLTKRDWDEWKYTNSYGWASSTVVSIPCFQNDWGVIAALTEGWTEIVYEIFDIDNVSLGSATLNVSRGSTDANKLKYCIAYPKTLSDNAVLDALGVTPDDLEDDWHYYVMYFRDSGVQQVSPYFIFYKECDARYTPVRIGFTNSMGGWDYFNFTAKSTPSFTTERKRYKRVLGTYGEGYSQNSWDRGMKEFGANTQRYIEVTAPNMTAEKYAFLVDLIRSDNIELIPQDGSEQFEGLILENTQYAQEQCIKAEQKTLTLRFRYANDLW